MWQVWKTDVLYAGSWWGDLSGREFLEDIDVDGRVILKYNFKTCDGEAWARLIWLKVTDTR
jgi:hypothetical protein